MAHCHCKMCQKFHGAAFSTFAASNDSGKLIEFALGTLDSQISQHSDAHVHTASKASWFEIYDDLPQYSGDRLKNHK